MQKLFIVLAVGLILAPFLANKILGPSQARTQDDPIPAKYSSRTDECKNRIRDLSELVKTNREVRRLFALGAGHLAEQAGKELDADDLIQVLYVSLFELCLEETEGKLSI